jgi:competence protein ComEC
MTRFQTWCYFILTLVMLAGCRRTGTVTIPDTPPSAPPANTLQVVFFDIGQGDSALIRFPDGKTMLVDGGQTSAGEMLVERLEAMGIQELDWMVASHPHSDHIGGLIAVVKQLKVKEVWDTGFPYESPVLEDYLKALQAAKQNGTSLKIIGAGYKVEPSPGCVIEVYAPRKPYLKNTSSDANNNSMLFRLRYGNASFLFTGDIEGAGRKKMMAEHPDLRSTLLKVAHHGSHNGTDRTFLSAVNPKIAVISCGRGNSYGHPHKEALQLLKQYGVTVYRTDEQGIITVTVRGDKLEVATEYSGSSEPPNGLPGRNTAPGMQREMPGIGGSFIGNPSSHIYHASDCSSLPNPNNRVYFKSEKEAKNAGYHPHRQCLNP